MSDCKLPLSPTEVVVADAKNFQNGFQQEKIAFAIRDLNVLHRSDRKATIEHSRLTTVAVLKNLTFSVPRGCNFAILGCSGSGKSTLLSILGGLRTKRSCNSLSGSVKYIDPNKKSYDVLDDSHAHDDYRGRRLGFVLPGNSLLSGFTCLQNLCLPLWSQKVPRAVAKQRAINLVEKFEATYQSVRKLVDVEDESLLEHLHKLPGAVSSGQRQRFAVLRSIVHDPDVVLADEPFSNLDPINHDTMLALLSSWRIQSADIRTVLLVSHDWERAISWADYVAVLHQGKLVGDRVLSVAEARCVDLVNQLIEGRRNEVGNTCVS